MTRRHLFAFLVVSITMAVFSIIAYVAVHESDVDSLGAVRVITAHTYSFVGDAETSSFHKQDCERVKEIRKSDRVYFRTCKAALDRGFQRCERCNPSD